MILMVYETIISDAKAKKAHVKLLAAKASISGGAHKLRAYLDSADATVELTSKIGQKAAAVANISDVLDHNF